MRHRIVGRTLGRNSPHRTSMYRNMFVSLIQHERIITTEPKAKELRRFAEKLITIAKRGVVANDNIKLLHAKRLVISALGPVGKVELVDDDGDYLDQTVLHKLFNEVAPRYKDRPGGYTRIIKRHERRLGDAGATAFIELLKEGEEKVRAKGERQVAAPAPVPVLAPTPEPTSEPSSTTEPTSSNAPEPVAQTPAPTEPTAPAAEEKPTSQPPAS